jgi:UDP-N-acetylmuramyl pentapeptide phosphotransferase/UDP-N-acetylglucosamine-1-phosphate transferase
MYQRRKNTLTEVLVASLGAAAFVDRGFRGLVSGQTSMLSKYARPTRYLYGDGSVWLALIYFALAGVLIGYLLRFNPWRNLIYLGMFIAWVALCVVILW